nr:2-succinyl-6-hydroxy-2,4-cyclohexadiene-1-carboxylate synthase [Halorhodospira abdelmalekii]
MSWGEAGRPTVVLVHGFMGDPQEWAPVAEALQPDWHCMAPQLPGHAGEVVAAESLPELAEALWTSLERHLPERFAVLGYSLGGRLALQWAAQPERAARLTALLLEGAHPGLRSAAERAQRWAADQQWAQRFTTEPWPEPLTAWYRQPVFASLSEAQRRALIERRARHSPHHLAAVLRAASLAKQADMRPVLAEIAAPITFIAGSEDTKFSALADELAAQLPRLRVAKLAGLGHNCHAEAPERVARVIHGTLEGERTEP